MDFEKEGKLVDGYLKTYESLFQMMYELDFSLINAFELDNREKYIEFLKYLGKKEQYPLDKDGEPVLNYDDLLKDKKNVKFAGHGSTFFALQRILIQIEYNKEKK